MILNVLLRIPISLKLHVSGFTTSSAAFTMLCRICQRQELSSFYLGTRRFLLRQRTTDGIWRTSYIHIVGWILCRSKASLECNLAILAEAKAALTAAKTNVWTLITLGVLHGDWTWLNYQELPIIELDDGKIYRKALYLMVKTMVSCRFSLKPIQWTKIIKIQNDSNDWDVSRILSASWPRGRVAVLRPMPSTVRLYSRQIRWTLDIGPELLGQPRKSINKTAQKDYKRNVNQDHR